MNREPFFGPNAKPFFIQAAAGVIAAMAISYFLGPSLEVWSKWIVRLIFSAFE